MVEKCILIMIKISFTFIVADKYATKKCLLQVANPQQANVTEDTIEPLSKLPYKAISCAKYNEIVQFSFC